MVTLKVSGIELGPWTHKLISILYFIFSFVILNFLYMPFYLNLFTINGLLSADIQVNT
jgi:hypothetical protein